MAIAMANGCSVLAQLAGGKEGANDGKRSKTGRRATSVAA
jgi:hypothetical protein